MDHHETVNLRSHNSMLWLCLNLWSQRHRRCCHLFDDYLCIGLVMVVYLVALLNDYEMKIFVSLLFSCLIVLASKRMLHCPEIGTTNTLHLVIPWDKQDLKLPVVKLTELEKVSYSSGLQYLVFIITSFNSPTVSWSIFPTYLKTKWKVDSVILAHYYLCLYMYL